MSNIILQSFHYYCQLEYWLNLRLIEMLSFCTPEFGFQGFRHAVEVILSLQLIIKVIPWLILQIIYITVKNRKYLTSQETWRFDLMYFDIPVFFSRLKLWLHRIVLLIWSPCHSDPCFAQSQPKGVLNSGSLSNSSDISYVGIEGICIVTVSTFIEIQSAVYPSNT